MTTQNEISEINQDVNEVSQVSDKQSTPETIDNKSGSKHSAPNDLNNKVEKVAKDLDMSKDQMIKEIERLKTSIASLSSNIRDTRTVVEKYDNDNQYLQDYVGTLMKNNEK